jgi:hypothetical protein
LCAETNRWTRPMTTETPDIPIVDAHQHFWNLDRN